MTEKFWPDPMDKNKNLSPFKKDLGEPLAEGSHSKISRYDEKVGNKSIVIKEGKTTYTPPLLKFLQKFTTLNREKVSQFLEKRLGPQFKIQPDFDFVKNGVAEQYLMSEYFRCDQDDPNGGLQKRDETIAALQNQEDPFNIELENSLGSAESVAVLADIAKKHRMDNFLPKELGTVIGHPSDLTKEKAAELQVAGEKLPSTYFIVQEEVAGKNPIPLLELDENELTKHPEVLEKLLMFAVLTKKMYADAGKLIDLRPEEILKNPFEYFQKTANVLVNLDENKGESDVYFVDSRWLWDKKSRVGEGGIDFIKYLGIASIDRAIKKYLGLLQKNKAKK